jgi:hypothetical protein
VDIYPLEPVARRSQNIGALVGALAAAQLTFQPVRKDQDNPYYHSKYADLSTVIAATQPSLAKNGLVVMQESTVDVQRQRVTVTTMLAHSSGEWKEHELTLPAVMMGKDGRIRFDAQSCGAAITYARRYSYQGIVGVAAELDDDANSAIGRGSTGAAQDVAKQKLEELAKHPKPEIAAMAKDSLAKIRASETANDLEGQLRASVPKAIIPKDDVLQSSLEAQKDEGLFEEIGGVIQQVREMATSKEKGSKSYRRVGLTTTIRGELRDIELVSWDNFVLSNGKLWDFLNKSVENRAGVFLCEVGEFKGKPSYTIRDVKAIGDHSWDNRLGD